MIRSGPQSFSKLCAPSTINLGTMEMKFQSTTHVPGTSRDAHEGRSKGVVHPPQPFAFGVDWFFSRHI
jgi:hypothetical protein